MTASQKEYIHRINKVIDYVDAHIDQELNLEILSRVALFSPFHFHRIFTVFTGETVNNYVKRLRTEKAARLLIDKPDMPVNDIAYACGFNSASVFCRAFKQQFKMSAGELRRAFQKPESKNGQFKRKIGKIQTSEDDYVCRIETLKNGGLIMNTKTEVKNMPEMKLVYTRHTGPFHLIAEAYEKLFKWAGPRGLLNSPDMKTVTVYHDDPKVTEIEKLRQSACILTDKEVKTEGEFGQMTVPAGKYITGRFEIRPDEFEKAWDTMCVALSESGYGPAEGLAYELYHQDPESHPENKFVLDICIPVEPM